MWGSCQLGHAKEWRWVCMSDSYHAHDTGRRRSTKAGERATRFYIWSAKPKHAQGTNRRQMKAPAKVSMTSFLFKPKALHKNVLTPPEWLPPSSSATSIMNTSPAPFATASQDETTPHDSQAIPATQADEEYHLPQEDQPDRDPRFELHVNTFGRFWRWCE